MNSDVQLFSVYSTYTELIQLGLVIMYDSVYLCNNSQFSCTHTENVLKLITFFSIAAL